MVLAAPFDDVLKNDIGALGRWQWELFCLVTLPMFVPLSSFPAFGIFIPHHRCYIPSLDGVLKMSYDNVTHLMIPWKNNPEEPPMIGQKYNPCLQYKIQFPENLTTLHHNDLGVLDFIRNTSKIGQCENGFKFDHRNVFSGSLVEEFELVCHKEYLGPLSTTIYLVGSVVSCWIVGYISDGFGRRPVMIICALTTFIFSGLAALSPNIYTFIALRVIIGFCDASLYVTTFLYLMEITNSHYRNIFSAVGIIIISQTAESSVPLLAYLLQNWRLLHFCVGCFGMPSIFYYWFLPESPRWLISRGREVEAKVIIRSILHKNKPQLSEHEIDSIIDKIFIKTEQDENEDVCKLINNNNLKSSGKNQTTPTVDVLFQFFKQALLLLKNSILRKRILISLFIWFEICMVYYGVNYYSVNLSGNMYLIYWLMVVMAIPGSLLTFILYNKFGRNRPFFILTLLSVPLLATGALIQIFRSDQTYDLPIVIVLSVTKVFFDAFYSMVFIYTPELFPTDMRNAGLAICSSMGRIGAAMAPLVIQLGISVWRPFPLTIFAFATLVGGICIAFLPETKHIPMPDSVAELEAEVCKHEPIDVEIN